jgi:hypothetical protein
MVGAHGPQRGMTGMVSFLSAEGVKSSADECAKVRVLNINMHCEGG